MTQTLDRSSTRSSSFDVVAAHEAVSDLADDLKVTSYSRFNKKTGTRFIDSGICRSFASRWLTSELDFLYDEKLAYPNDESLMFIGNMAIMPVTLSLKSSNPSLISHTETEFEGHHEDQIDIIISYEDEKREIEARQVLSLYAISSATDSFPVFSRSVWAQPLDEQLHADQAEDHVTSSFVAHSLSEIHKFVSLASDLNHQRPANL